VEARSAITLKKSVVDTSLEVYIQNNVPMFLSTTSFNTLMMAEKVLRTVDVPLHTREGKLTFVTLVIMMYTMALFISVALHEIIGHGVGAILVGGDFYAVFITPGSGYASIYLPTGISDGARAYVYLAGIFVELVLGLILLFLILPRLKGFMTSLFALVLSGAMLVHPSIYLLLGTLYDRGDSYRAISVLDVPPDLFVALGLIFTGIFTILISIAALNRLGCRMGDGDDRSNIMVLTIFWIPQIILGIASAIAAAVILSQADLTYTLANASILLLFIGVAIYIVPHISEPREFRKCNLGFRKVMATLVCFIVVLSVWVGTFGVSDSSAHGLLLSSQPPVEVEPFYNDYSVGDYGIGNAHLMIHADGNVSVSITLRNIMNRQNHSILDERIYETFNERPYWDYYIERTRYMLTLMFDLDREVAQNLTFGTSLDFVRAKDINDQYGRVCTTTLEFEFIDNVLVEGVRQWKPGGLGSTAGGEGSTDALLIIFEDPWAIQGGFLDEVTLSWDEELNLTHYSASNNLLTHIQPTIGNITDFNLDSEIGWENEIFENSPSLYKFILRKARET